MSYCSGLRDSVHSLSLQITSLFGEPGDQIDRTLEPLGLEFTGHPQHRLNIEVFYTLKTELRKVVGVFTPGGEVEKIEQSLLRHRDVRILYPVYVPRVTEKNFFLDVSITNPSKRGIDRQRPSGDNAGRLRNVLRDHTVERQGRLQAYIRTGLDRAGNHVQIDTDMSVGLTQSIPSLMKTDYPAAFHPPAQLNAYLIDVIAGGNHTGGKTVEVGGKFNETGKHHCNKLTLLINYCNFQGSIPITLLLKEKQYIKTQTETTMQYKLDMSIIILTCVIIVLGLGTALAGLLSERLYQGNSVSLIAQGKGQDLVTAVIAVPATILLLVFAARGSYKAQLALAGLIGYFLYTYASYLFLWKFNNLFLGYVATFSSSLFAFILLMLSLFRTASGLTLARAPAVFCSVLLFLVAGALLFMWLSQVFSAMQGKSVPILTDTGGHAVIQGLDLGVLVPAAILVGVMLLKGSSAGLVWLPVILVKGLTMGLAIVSMTIFMARAGTPDSAGAVIFSVLSVLFLGGLVWVFTALKVGETAAG
jgi:hypothetical protein